MAITSRDSYINAVKFVVFHQKTASRTSVANIPFSVFDLAGNPGAGVLAIGNTANGIVPTDVLSGYPILPTPTDNLYLSTIEYKSSVASWLHLYDCLFSAGAYTYNADVSLTSQPSFLDRLPRGSYAGLELWIEAVTAFTGSPSIQVNYLDQDGNAGDTGAYATGAALIVGRMAMLPLAGGDSGIQQITRVRGTVASAGTFNVHVMRYLYGGRINGANQGGSDSLLKTGLPQIYGTSALRMIVTADSTATGLPSMRMILADG